MIKVSVSDLKANPSAYIRSAQRGEEVQILVRNQVVARLVAAGPALESMDQRRQRLVKKGVLRAGSGNIRNVVADGMLPGKGLSLGAAVQDERGDRL